MRRSGATALGTTRWQDAAELTPLPRRVSGLRAPFAQDSTRVFSKVCSKHLPSRIKRNLLKTKDRVTLYPSQYREVLFSREPRTPCVRSSSAESTSHGFPSRKELECNRFESQTWKSEGGFSWRLILL